MTSKLKSAIFRRTESIRRSKLSNLTDNLRNRVTLTDEGSLYGSNEYIHKDFYEDKNYLSIIKCIDGGYAIADDLIKFMQNYNECLEKQIDNLKSLSKRSKSKIKSQSSLSSYHTTKRAQMEVVNILLREADQIQVRYDAIQNVINEFRTEIDRLYSGEHSNSRHKHSRTSSLIDAFEAARSQLSRLSAKIEKFNNQKADIEDALREARIKCENLNLSYGVSESKIEKANNTRVKQENKLESIEKDIIRTEEEYKKEKKIYRTEAARIYEKCRTLEEERLDLLGDTLMLFIEAAYTPEHAKSQHAMYKEIISHLELDRNPSEDLKFWAQSYHVYKSEIESDDETQDENVSTVTKKKSHKKESANTTTTIENIPSTLTEYDEEPSSADTSSSTTSAKTKSKKK